jgi:peroxiredoxin
MVLAASLALSLGSAAVAQGGGGGGGRGPGMMGRFGGGGGLPLLRMPEVQRELKMTAEQIGKIDAKQEEVRAAMQAMIQGGGGNLGQLSTEERRARMTRMQEIQSKAVKDILDTTQQKRFRQLELQQQGPLAIAVRKDVADELKLSEEQQKQVAEIQRQSQDEMRSAMQGANFQSMSPEERGQMMARMRQMQTSAGDKVAAVLTDAQKAQWKEMLGAPFTFPVPPGGAPRPAAGGGAAAPSQEPRPGAANNGEQAEIGKPVRDFRLRDLTEKNKETYHTLSQYRGKKAVVAVFLSNRCGTTWQYEERMGKLMQDMVGKDVVVLGIHSNVNESQDEIRKYVETRNFAAPVLDDKEKNEFVTYFDARVTPTVLVIDKEGVLRYKGSYDDNADAKMVKTRYAEDALNAVLTGKAVPVTTTRAFG